MKKKLFIIIPIILVFILGIIVIAYIIRWPTFLFPKADGGNISGNWIWNTTATSPQTDQYTSNATISQDATGAFTGTITDPDGYTDPLNGTVTGTAFKTDPVTITGNEQGFDFEATYYYEGTVSSDANSISGDLKGNYTKPAPGGPISGTFTASRGTAVITPSPTPSPTATPTPTASGTQTTTPTASGSATPTSTSTSIATKTPAPTGSGITATQPPVPDTGLSLPTVLFVGSGLLIFAVSLLFLI